MAKHCNFKDLHDSLIRDRIVFGICNRETAKKLLEKKDFSLKVCIDICRASEAMDTRVKHMATAVNSSAEIHKVKTFDTRKRTDKLVMRQHRPQSQSVKSKC